MQVRREEDNSPSHRQKYDGQGERKELETRKLNMREDGHKRREEFDVVRPGNRGEVRKEAASNEVVEEEAAVVTVVHIEFDRGGECLLAMETVAQIEEEAVVEVGVHKLDSNFQDLEDCRGGGIGKGTMEVESLGSHQD